MSLKTWWRAKSGKAKTITTLCVLIILNTGLCFLIPSAAEMFHLGGQDPMSGLGLMVVQAGLDILLVFVLICVAIFWRPGRNSPDVKEFHD
jgi:hypothetical protein